MTSIFNSFWQCPDIETDFFKIQFCFEKQNNEIPSINSCRLIYLKNCDTKMFRVPANRLHFPFKRNETRLYSIDDKRGLLLHANRESILPCVIQKYGFGRAYDSLSQNYLFEVLTLMNFPTKLIKLLKWNYGKRTFKLLVNSHISGKIQLGRGVFQRCSTACPDLF